MDLTDILGYLGALFIGVVLGLVGGGGSILTVPVLVYLMAVNPVTATAYSLFVVGATSLFGSVRNLQKKRVDLKTAAVFSIPSFIAVYLTRKFLVPAIPETIVTIGELTITKNVGIMLFFACITILASLSMILEPSEKANRPHKIRFNYLVIILEGVVVGVLTGIVGAGGGFLIIPVLVLMVKLPMKRAVATSLVIISAKSLIGFIGDVQNLEIQWVFLLIFTTISIAGIYLGIWLNRFIDGKKLKKGFGWFVLLMGLYIFWKEIF